MPDTRSTPDRAPRPPVCPGLPFIGNAYQLLSDPCGFFTSAHRLLGPVFRARAAGRTFSVIAGDAARRFMAEGLDESCLTRHPIFDPLEREFGGGDFVMAHTGLRHTRLRPPLAITFSRQLASPFVPALAEDVRTIARHWRPGSRVRVIDVTSRMAMAQWRRLLGPGAVRLIDRDCRRLSAFWMMVGATLLPPIIFRAPWYQRAHRRTFAVFRALIHQTRSIAPAPGTPPTIVEALGNARDSEGVPLTDDEAVTYLAYGTLGACAYAARLAAFMVYEVVRDRQLMEALCAEAAQAFAAGLRQASDLRRMPLLQSVYQESLRRHPVSPGMPFVAARTFDFAGHRIHAGEPTVLTPVPLAFSPGAFPDPERFDPARCRAPRNEHRSGRCHPFGLGNRTCVAGGLVEVLCVTLVASLLHEREVALDPPGYRLRLSMRPLPAPNRRLRLRVGGAAAARIVAPMPAAAPEELRLVAFPGHDDPAVRAALGRARIQHFAAGTTIIREGGEADAYYLIQTGTAIVTKGDPPVLVAELSTGDGFGETGLLQNAPRNATVTAGDASAGTLVLDREAFLAMVAGSDLVADEIRGLMQKRIASNRLQMIAPVLTASAVARVLPDFTWVTVPAGDVIIREGDAAQHFFVLVEGAVEVSRRMPDGADRVLAVLGPGEYFGEVGLLHRAPRNATVTAGPDTPVAVLRTDAAGFDRLLNQTGAAGAGLAQTMLSCVERLEGR